MREEGVTPARPPFSRASTPTLRQATDQRQQEENFLPTLLQCPRAENNNNNTKRDFSINFSRLKSTGNDCADPSLYTCSLGALQSPPPPTCWSQRFRNYTRIFWGSGSFSRVVKPWGAQVTTWTLSAPGPVRTGVPAQPLARPRARRGHAPGARAPELEMPRDPWAQTSTSARSTC